MAQNNSQSVNIFFDFDKYSLSQKELKKLVEVTSSFDSLKVTKVSIVGYCDDLGSTTYNDNLSKKRVVYLESKIKGIIGEKDVEYQCEGKGELSLENTNERNYKEQREYNRRVEVVFETGDDFIVLENVNFEGGKTNMLSPSYKVLNKFLTTLKDNEKIKLIIYGHIANIGRNDGYKDGLDTSTGKYNLSEARAKKVYDYLVKNGISKDRLSYKGLGSAFPTGKGAYYDRRVEVKILK